MSYSLAVDIGGTFTDVVLMRDDGALVADKTLTTHHDLLDGLFRGVDLVLDRAKITPAAIDGVVVHATTVVTNALIERKGPPTALIMTKGFGDVLAIRNEHRYAMYDPQIEFAEPLIPRDLTFEIDERTLADGSILRAVSEAEIDVLARSLRAKGIVSAAVCLINGFRNPANEHAVAAMLKSRLPELYLSLSSSVAPQIREYPRASTAAINAYTSPITEPYLRELTLRLASMAVPNKPLVMLSSGGIIGAEVAARNPVRMIESGPAAGALAAAYFAHRLGLDRLLSFDMGGTTAKACLIENCKPMVASSFEVDRMYRFCEGSGMPLTVPSIDMIEIGAGGGSIASVDTLGLLKVGPRSAGSEPGPACYARGGREPTVTDADLVLGLVDPENFLGGSMPLDRGAAESAIARLGLALGTNLAQTAAGIYRIVAETMAAAGRTHAVERGVDHRGLPLLAFGGAGPVHACAVGELLQSTAVIFPPQASVLSAFGTLVTSMCFDLVRSAPGALETLNWADAERHIDDMMDEGRRALLEAGCDPAKITPVFGADLRYFGQQNELTVVLNTDPRPGRDIAMVRRCFESAYLAQYGIIPSHVPIEIVNWRLTVRGPETAVETARMEPRPRATPRTHRPLLLWPDAGNAPVYDRGDLAVGQCFDGPVVIEERETTTIIPPSWRACVNALGCIVAERGR